MFTQHLPTRVVFGAGLMSKVGSFVRESRPLIVTSPGFRKRGVIDELVSALRLEVQLIDTVAPLPSLEFVADLYRSVHERKSFDVIIALGGGSVIDTAKVLSVTVPGGKFRDVEAIIRGEKNRTAYSLSPVIAIPTTAGTSSEITPWATVWDTKQHEKLSLHLDDLWPSVALCDPELTLTMPAELTLQTGLDALSHALESIWNHNRNPLSLTIAQAAVEEILKALPQVLKDPQSLEWRETMMTGSFLAGSAFSQTKTSLAHALSYYLTLFHDIPHGIACSFSLPHVARAALGVHPDVDQALRACLGPNPVERLEQFLQLLGVSTALSTYLPRAAHSKLDDYVTSVPRLQNFIGSHNLGDIFPGYK